MPDHPQIPDDLWHSTTRPARYNPSTRKWSVRRCGTTVWAGTMSPDRPGRTRPITRHPVRAEPLINDPQHAHQELCRYHYGRFKVNRRGRIVITFCHRPDFGGEIGDYLRGRGYFYVDGDTGRTRGVASMQLPTTIVGFFDSYGVHCGAPI